MSTRPSAARTIDFGGWFMAELDKRGWTRKMFAERAGLAYASLPYKWAANEHRPQPDYCQLIATTLRLDLDVVLFAAGHRPCNQAAPGIIRSEWSALLGQADEVLLTALLPWLRAICDERIANETIVRIAERLPGTSRDESRDA